MSKAVRSSAAAPRVQRVAVLGAGIMGSCLSLFLARKGIDVTLFDMAPTPMGGASRWNEGKIHLGYLYSADPSLRTTRTLLPGGLAFSRLVSDLLEESLADEITGDDEDMMSIATLLDPKNADIKELREGDLQDMVGMLITEMDVDLEADESDEQYSISGGDCGL